MNPLETISARNRTCKIDTDADAELLRLAKVYGTRYSALVNACVRHGLGEIGAGRLKIDRIPVDHVIRLTIPPAPEAPA